jgi:deoxycytidylate deaminase
MKGPCAKRTVTCRIENEHPSGETEYVEGTNWCANALPACPRLPGEDYTKCRTICQQSGHAEINALELARKSGIYVRGGRAMLSGHYWICEPCGRALKEAGIATVTIKL